LSKLLRVGGSTLVDRSLKTITLNSVIYLTNTFFVSGVWTKIATVPTNFRPTNTVQWDIPKRVDATQFTNFGGTGMTGTSFLTEASARIKPNGDLEVYMTGPSYANLGGSSILILPLHITYFYISGA